MAPGYLPWRASFEAAATTRGAVPPRFHGNSIGTPRQSEAATTFVRVSRAFSCLAVDHRTGGGDYLLLPFADASLPFGDYAPSFGVGPTVESSDVAREQRRHL